LTAIVAIWVLDLVLGLLSIGTDFGSGARRTTSNAFERVTWENFSLEIADG